MGGESYRLVVGFLLHIIILRLNSMNCKNCGNSISENIKFCGKCGTEQTNKGEVVSGEPKQQKSFKLDMSKDANRLGLEGVGLLILIRVLGPIFGSYLLAGIVSGVIIYLIDLSFKRKG